MTKTKPLIINISADDRTDYSGLERVRAEVVKLGEKLVRGSDLAKDSKGENTKRAIEKKRLLTVFSQKVA